MKARTSSLAIFPVDGLPILGLFALDALDLLCRLQRFSRQRRHRVGQVSQAMKGRPDQPTVRARRLGWCIASAVFIFAGCMQTYWTKPDFTQADWNRDSYECERDMRQSGYYGGGIVGQINAQEFFDRCLVAKGYYKQIASPQPSSPAPPPRSSEPVPLPPGQNFGDTVPESQRDPRCTYSADGVLVACPRW